MGIKIKDKDISVGANGYPEIVKGIDEYLQRAYIALSAVKGEFCYLRELGAFKELKSIENMQELKKEAQAALFYIPEISVESVKKENGEVFITLVTPLGTGEIKL